jgi:putative nucleotidyltransferase with HDIG domain
VLGWLRRLLGPGSGPPPKEPHVPATPGAASAPAAPVEGSTAPAPSDGADAADPFTPFARALGVPVPAEPAPLGEEEELAELELAARLLDHCRRNKLGPASSPTLSLRILNMVASPGAEISELARIIAADPALSAGVLNVANSAWFRGVDEVETVRDAVTRLGLDEVGRVAGALSAKSLFNPRLRQEQATFGPRFTALYRRAITVATAAAALAMRTRARSDRCYLGGMLHDVGRTVALRSVALLHLEHQAAPGLGDPLLDRVLDRVHVELGAELHQEWQLPQYLTVLAVRHHDAGIPADEEFRDLHVVRLAAATYDLRTEPATAWRASREIVQSAGALRLDANGVRALAAELRMAEEKVSTTFGLDAAAPSARRA